MNEALLVVDVQKTFEDDEKWGPRSTPQAEQNMKRLLDKWRKHDKEAIFIRHLSQDPGSAFYPEKESSHFKDIIAPAEDEVIFTKEVNSAFIGTKLHSYLSEKNITSLVIIGLTTPHCVSTTARMSGNLGYETYVISDACAAHALKDHQGDAISPETVHQVSLASLHEEFATVLSTEQLIKKIDDEYCVD
ncbi:cysteine hydrolase [Halobacillus litoralis]|uniref:cysteine hydrolase family protein n=1 Tax=Halobacillus litoralis TaxID=45668 RepID=UPI001CD2A1A3|nr:cysteine hydrolase family protein [Halobacillus litoralis]MCA0969336.1 cysteine hydrolase [Halobacillus litoralis]